MCFDFPRRPDRKSGALGTELLHLAHAAEYLWQVLHRDHLPLSLVFFPERLGNRALGGNVQARGTSSADVRDVNHGSRCRRVALSLDPWPSSRFLSAGLVSLADYAKV